MKRKTKTYKSGRCDICNTLYQDREIKLYIPEGKLYCPTCWENSSTMFQDGYVHVYVEREPHSPIPRRQVPKVTLPSVSCLKGSTDAKFDRTGPSEGSWLHANGENETPATDDPRGSLEDVMTPSDE